MNKNNAISFLVSSKSMKKAIEKNITETEEMYEDIKFSVDIVDMANCLEVAKKKEKEGTKIIITKIAIKLKIEDEIDIPVINMNNTVSDYIEFLKDIDLKKNKIVFSDYVEANSSLLDLINLLSKDISFEFFETEDGCKKIIEKSDKNKVDIIVGGSLIKSYARDSKIKVLELPVSEDSLEMYKEIAVDLLENLNKKTIKEKFFENIEKVVEEYLKAGKPVPSMTKVNMNDIEKDKIIEVLKENSFSVSKTSKVLGISRTTLWRKLKKYEIELN